MKQGRTSVFKMLLITAVLIGGFGLLEAQFAGGNGTAADPWQIETAEHLNNVRNYLGAAHSDKHFIQTANIDLGDFLWDEDAEEYINDGEGWIPIGNEENRFTGKYNGNSKTISSLYINRSYSDHQGLFGYTDAAVINNLGVIDVEITGHKAVGGLAGLINNSTVTNCFTTGNVTGASYAGGLAGRSSGNSEVFDCHSNATVSMYVPPEAMVLVEGGTFSPAANYTVTLSSFYISKYEVTQSEWTSVMGGIYNPDWTDRGQGPTHPAYRISWFDAIEYCNRLSIREGLTPAYSYGQSGTNPANWPAGWNTSNGNHTNVSCNWNANGYRLPTEMEWEFAARGGVPARQAGTFYTTYAGSNNVNEVAWYSGNSDTGAGRRSHPVGTKLPNELGLYDMSGNVWNWCWDMTNSPMTPYPTGVHNNPTGPTTGTHRFQRGGRWSSTAYYCTVSYRLGSRATHRSNGIGFRVCRRIP